MGKIPRRTAVYAIISLLILGAATLAVLRPGAVTSSASALPIDFDSRSLSPDGKWCVVQIIHDDIKSAPLGLVAASGKGELRRLAGTERASDVAWSADSQAIYFTYIPSAGTELSSIKKKSVLDDTAPVTLLSDKKSAISHPSPSPDGTYLASTHVRADAPSAREMVDVVHVRNLKTSEDVTLSPYPSYDLSHSLQWSDDGRILAFRTGRYKQEGSTGLVLCQPQEKFNLRFLPFPPETLNFFVLSPDGKAAALLGGRDKRGFLNAISIVNTASGQEIRKWSGSQIAPAMVWSRDGKYLCFVDSLFSGAPRARWLEVSTGEVETLVPSGDAKRIALVGRHGNTLFYSLSIDRKQSRLSTVDIE